MERVEKNRIIEEFRGMKNGKLILLSGEEGIGKTTLLNDICNEISKEFFCFYIKYFEASVDEFFYSILERIKKEVPSLRLGIVEAISKKSSDPLNILISIVTVMSSFKNILMIFDDVEKYNREILDRILFLIRSIIDSKIMIIISYDENFVNKNFNEFLIKTNELPQESIIKIKIEGLSRENINDIIKEMGYTLPKYLTDKIYNATQGNPGKMKEIILELKSKGLIDGDNYWVGTFEDIPEVKSHKYAALDIMNSLDENEKDFLLYASVYGKDFDIFHIAKLRNMKNDELIELVNSLVDKKIIEERSENVYSFARQEYREILYQSMSNIKRRYLHKKIGEFLEKSCDCPEIIGNHFYFSGEYERAKKYLLEAAERKFKEGNYRYSYEIIKKYMEIESNPDIVPLSLMIDILIKLGFYKEALRYVEIAKNKKPENIDILIKEAYIRYNIGDYEGAENILASINENVDLEKSFYYNLIRGGIELRRANISNAEDNLKKALEIAWKIRDNSFLAIVHKELGNLNYYIGRLDEAYENYLQSYQFYEKINDYEGLARIYNNISLIDINRDVKRALDDYQKSLFYADMSGNAYLSIAIRLNLSQLYFWSGKVKEAEKEIKIGFELSEISGEQEIRHSIYSYLSDIYLLKGNFNEAIKKVEEAIKISNVTGAKYFESIYELKKREILAIKGIEQEQAANPYDPESVMGITVDLYNSLILLYSGKFKDSSELLENALRRGEGKFTFIDTIIFEGNLPFVHLLNGNKLKFIESYEKLKKKCDSINMDILYLHSLAPTYKYLKNFNPELENEEKFMVDNKLMFLLLKTYLIYYNVSYDANILEKIKEISKNIGFDYIKFIKSP